MRKTDDTPSSPPRLRPAILAALGLALLWLLDLLAFTDLGGEVVSLRPLPALFLLAYAFALAFLFCAAALLLLSLAAIALKPFLSPRAEARSRLAAFSFAWALYYGWTAGRRLLLVSSLPARFLLPAALLLAAGFALAAGLWAKRASAERAAAAGPALLGGLVAFRLSFFLLDALFFTPLSRRVLPWAAIGFLLSLSAGAAVCRFLLDPVRRERLLRPLERIAPFPAALLILAAGAALLWELREVRPPEAPAPGGGAAGKNVVLIVVDALRADRISAAGCPRPTTPRLDELGREGARFENCYAAAAWTKPAVASLLTSLYPDAHGARRREDRLPSEARTLAEILRESGWFTAAVVANPNLKSVFGFDQGFAAYDDSLMRDRLYEIALRPFFFRPLLSRRLGRNFDLTDRDHAESVNRRALPLLDRSRGGAFFLYLHYMEPHFPRDPPARFLALFPSPEGDPAAAEAARYDAAVRFADDRIGALLDRLRALGIYDRTAVVVTADHGEAFGEHSDSGHGHTIYQEMVRVPLVVKGWGEAPGTVVSLPVRSIDILPTVLDALALPPESGAEGRSLLPLLRGREAAAGGKDVFFDEESFDGAFLLRGALREGRWKYILTERSNRKGGRGPGDEELYDLAADPGETRDLAAEEPAILAELRRALRLHLADPGRTRRKAPAAVLDRKTVDQIRALGYM